jgi:hypothetical protein
VSELGDLTPWSGDLTPYLLPFPSLSQAQCDARAELAAPLRPSQRLDVMQTHTESGGTHLYVRVGTHEFHVARSGSIVDLGTY